MAVNLFHLRTAIVDRREFFWEDQEEFEPGAFFDGSSNRFTSTAFTSLNSSTLPPILKAATNWRVLKRETRIQSRNSHTATGHEKSNARFGGDEFETQLRSAFPRDEAILNRDSNSDGRRPGLTHGAEPIECFDISHIQGTDKVASMVVWEDGKMKKADYRKFIIRTVEGNNDFASCAKSSRAATAVCRKRNRNFLAGDCRRRSNTY